MNRLSTYLLMAVVVMLACSAMAQDRGTPDEAKALVKKSVAYMKETGRDKALSELKNFKGKFVYKDLYVYAYSMETGINLAHPLTPALTGKTLIDLKDADGKLFVREMIETGKSKGGGTITYRWSDPKTKRVDMKYTYYEVVPGTDIIVACGYYKK